MSIVDLKPRDVPAELRVKIENVMRRKKLSWRNAVAFLASEVVSPSRAPGGRRVFSRPGGGFTSSAPEAEGVRA